MAPDIPAFPALQRKYVKEGMSVANARSKAEAVITQGRTARAKKNKSTAKAKADAKRESRASEGGGTQ